MCYNCKSYYLFFYNVNTIKKISFIFNILLYHMLMSLLIVLISVNKASDMLF